jgi:hypothetical protein
MAFDPESRTNTHLYFGTGGGFTGAVTSYYLASDGKIYAKKGEEITKLATVPKPMTIQIFNNYSKLGLDKMILSDPGNKYSFIERRESGESQRLTWGNSKLDNPNVQIFFDILMKAVKDNLPKETKS